MHHDHDPDRPGGDAPRVLEDVPPLLRLGVLEGHVEHPGELLPQVVRGRALDGPAAGGDEGLAGDGELAAGELLGLGLLAGDDGDGHEVLVDLAVEVGDVEDLGLGLLVGGEGRVALLPEELAVPQEGLRVLELPSLKK